MTENQPRLRLLSHASTFLGDTIGVIEDVFGKILRLSKDHVPVKRPRGNAPLRSLHSMLRDVAREMNRLTRVGDPGEEKRKERMAHLLDMSGTIDKPSRVFVGPASPERIERFDQDLNGAFHVGVSMPGVGGNGCHG